MSIITSFDCIKALFFPFRKNVKNGNEKKGKLKRENTEKKRKKLEHRFEHKDKYLEKHLFPTIPIFLNIALHFDKDSLFLLKAERNEVLRAVRAQELEERHRDDHRR